MTNGPQDPLCRGCKHYHSTWQVAQPHGCRAFGFQSKAMPDLVVLQESGEPCTKRTASGPPRDPKHPG